MQLRSSLVGTTAYRRVICPDDRIPTDEPIDGQRALVHELSFARQTLETWRTPRFCHPEWRKVGEQVGPTQRRRIPVLMLIARGDDVNCIVAARAARCR